MPIVAIGAVTAEEIAARPGRSIIYKHSATCSLCGWSNYKLGQLADEDGVTIELVDVFSQRALSQEIAARFGVRHESPQLLIIEDGEVLWHASHRGVAPERVRSALAGSLEGLGARM